MACAHCCYDCGPKGVDMSWKVFKAAVEHASLVALGGGEPTLHRQFWKYLAYAIAHCDEGVWLATNGSRTDDALTLAKMAERGVMGCALSLDPWHAPIDPKVRKAFTKVDNPHSYERTDHDMREIRTVTEHLSWEGRARTLITKPKKHECCCADILVWPDGKVTQCGCEDSPLIGDVFNGINPMDDDRAMCYLSASKASRRRLCNQS
jgi:hypothetical protein